jgi:hypothetical protein
MDGNEWLKGKQFDRLMVVVGVLDGWDSAMNLIVFETIVDFCGVPTTTFK